MKNTGLNSSGKGLAGIAFFLLGFIIALGIGWGVFPRVLYSEKTQPINFLHSSHEDSDCTDCHFTRDNGTYSGIPGIEKCAECHEDQQGDSEDERVLVEDYVQQDREIPWHVYAWQPDNVYFSHIAHTGDQGIECVRCHRDVTAEEKLPPFYEDRLTGYSKSTMKMVECEKCHADNGASNSCNTCHK